MKLVTWGFNRKKENLTTSSSTTQINLSPKVASTSSQDTLHNLFWIFGIIVLIFLIVIIIIVFILKYNRTKKKALTPPPECVPFDLTPKVLTMEMQMPILPPTISPASSNEPVELRRSQPANMYHNKEIPLTNHPPIHIEEFAEHLERLKAADNYKFSQEYEVTIGFSLISLTHFFSSSPSIQVNNFPGKIPNLNITKRKIAMQMSLPTIIRVLFYIRLMVFQEVIISMRIISMVIENKMPT